MIGFVKPGRDDVLQVSPTAIQMMGMALVTASSDTATTATVKQHKETSSGNVVVLP